MTGRPGFVYTLFAIVVMGLLALSLTLPIGIDTDGARTDQIGVDELYYFVSSIRSDMERAVDISGRRAMVGVANQIIGEGEYLETGSDAVIALVTYNGTFNGSELELLQRTALVDWIAKMEDQAAAAGYVSELVVDPDTVSVEGASPFMLRFAFRYNLTVYDPAIETGFNRTADRFSSPVSIESLEDPVIYLETAGRRSRSIQRCAVDPATRVMTGDASSYNRTYAGESRDWVGGTSAVTPGSVSGLGSDRVAFVEDHCSYAEADLDDLAGVVSEAADSCGYAGNLTGLVTGVDNASTVADDERVVLSGDTVWELGMPRMIEQGCFISDPAGPSYLDRLMGEDGSSTGIASLVDVPDLPPEVQRSNVTAVDHGYFNISSDLGPVSRIRGMTDTEESWFRLDQEHVEQWGLTALTYTP